MPNVILTTILGRKYNIHLHFANEETEGHWTISSRASSWILSIFIPGSTCYWMKWMELNVKLGRRFLPLFLRNWPWLWKNFSVWDSEQHGGCHSIVLHKSGYGWWNNARAVGWHWVEAGSGSEVKLEFLRTVSPPLSTVSLSAALVTHSQLHSKYIKYKIPEINKS